MMQLKGLFPTIQKRGLFQTIFGKNNQRIVTNGTYKLLNSYTSDYTIVGSDIYDNNIARECIDTIATHCAKLLPKHYKKGVHVEGDIDFLLSHPNPIMNKFDFIYKTLNMLYTYNNAFIYISKNKNGKIDGFFPVIATNMNLFEAKSGEPILQFRFVNGKDYLLPYKELIHLRRFYNRHDFYGEDNKILIPSLETAQVANDGIKNSVKLTNSLRGIIHYENAMLKDEDLRKNRDNFVKDYLSMQDNSGIATLDAKAKFETIDLNPVTMSKDQLQELKNNIYDYFRINENIIQGKYTPSQWSAFYESVVEPIAIQLSDEFTRKIFSDKSIKEGNKIIFSTNKIAYSDWSTKISLIKEAGALGLLKKDEAREIIELPAIGGEEGEKIIQSLNNIDSKIANDYQGGE